LGEWGALEILLVLLFYILNITYIYIIYLFLIGARQTSLVFFFLGAAEQHGKHVTRVCLSTFFFKNAYKDFFFNFGEESMTSQVELSMH